MRIAHRIACLLLLAAVSGCASLAAQRLAGGLSQAMLNQDDPETVRDGAPAYLLMLDGMIADDPHNAQLLIAGAGLYGAYAAVFVEDGERAGRMANKAFEFGQRAACRRIEALCDARRLAFEPFTQALAAAGKNDVPALFAFGAAWAGLIQTHSGEMGALADLPKVEALMERLAALDEGYEHGRAQLYLGVIRSQRPPALGGRPEVGRAHFERAIELSGGRDLIARVEFARSYARLMFDRELHDKLLNEVIAAEAKAPGLTLSNVLAQREARRLLAESAEYFGED